MQQQQGMPQVVQAQDIYFIPPPINELNKTYYQKLTAPDNPILQATKSYVSFMEVHPLQQPQWEKQHEARMITKSYKARLIELNRKLFSDVKKYMRAFSGFSPLSDLKGNQENYISQQIVHFMLEIEAVKKHQIRAQVCNKIVKQTHAIRARTKEINNQLQKIKNNFYQAQKIVKQQ